MHYQNLLQNQTPLLHSAAKSKQYTIVCSMKNLSMQTRNDLLKSVVEKIVFNKKESTIDVYFYTSNPL